MSVPIPNQFFFRFEVAIGKAPLAKTTRKANVPHDWLTDAHLLPALGALDHRPTVGQIFLGWNPQGLRLFWMVPNKEEPIHADLDRPKHSDGLSLWLDTRDTRDIHRASRFCQRFSINAHDGTPDGKPNVVTYPIARALDQPPAPDLSKITLQRFLFGRGDQLKPDQKTDPETIKAYAIEAFFPAEVLHGYDPDTNRRLGLCYRLRDHELGDQLSAAGPEFPYWEDPSLWWTCVLTD